MISISRLNPALALLACLLASSAGHAAIAGLLPGGADNYSECVIRQLQPATGALEIEAIVGECRGVDEIGSCGITDVGMELTESRNPDEFGNRGISVPMIQVSTLSCFSFL